MACNSGCVDFLQSNVFTAKEGAENRSSEVSPTENNRCFVIIIIDIEVLGCFGNVELNVFAVVADCHSQSLAHTVILDTEVMRRGRRNCNAVLSQSLHIH